MEDACSILSCSLNCRGSCLRAVFLSPNSSSPSYFLCSSDSSRTTSSSLDERHACFFLAFISCILGHAGRLTTQFVFSSNFTVFVDLQPARASSCHHRYALPPRHRNSLASAHVLDVRFLRSEQDDVSLVDNRTHGSNLASPSTCIGLPFTPFFRIGHRLWAAPASTVISTISCTTSTAFTSSTSSPRSVIF